ncbi:type VI secretion system baseplate subunit TssG [Bordetella avium]|uniref:type VI secretion system baseplate subunit TssG n=1 Tax=Bordetella avium TaxID=521 RepID=UPI0039FDDD56
MSHDLLARPYQFNFFQAVRLLEQMSGKQGGRAVRFRTRVGISFDASDVLAISRNGEGPFELTSNVLCIAGANGPLPLAYTEQVLQARERGDSSASDFLDIFNHRLMLMLFRARRRCYPALLGQGVEAPIWKVLRALTHLPADVEPLGAPASALLAIRTRSLAGLQTLIAERLHLRVRGASMQGGWIALEQATRARLGAASRLSDTALGRRAWNPAAGIALTLMPRHADAFTDVEAQALSAGGEGYRLLVACLRAYLRAPLDVEVRLAPTAGPVTRPRLGWSSWLGKACRQSPRFRLRGVPLHKG